MPPLWQRAKPGANKKSNGIVFWYIMGIRLVFLLVAAGIIVLVVSLVAHWKNNTVNVYKPAASAVQENIKDLQGSTNIDDQRSLVSNYVAGGQYGRAEQLAKQIADSTKQLKDYMSVITICATRAVSDQQSCVTKYVSIIKAQIPAMGFYESYVVASTLDDASFGKNALPFYQQALNTYDSVQHDVYTKTKPQIQQRIAQLNA